MDVDATGSAEKEKVDIGEYDQEDEHAPFPLLPMQRIYAIGRLLTTEGSNNAWISWVSEIAAFDQEKFEWAMTTLVRSLHDAFIATHKPCRKTMGYEELLLGLRTRCEVAHAVRVHAQGHETSRVITTERDRM